MSGHLESAGSSGMVAVGALWLVGLGAVESTNSAVAAGAGIFVLMAVDWVSTVLFATRPLLAYGYSRADMIGRVEVGG